MKTARLCMGILACFGGLLICVALFLSAFGYCRVVVSLMAVAAGILCLMIAFMGEKLIQWFWKR